MKAGPVRSLKEIEAAIGRATAAREIVGTEPPKTCHRNDRIVAHKAEADRPRAHSDERDERDGN